MDYVLWSKTKPDLANVHRDFELDFLSKLYQKKNQISPKTMGYVQKVHETNKTANLLLHSLLMI